MQPTKIVPRETWLVARKAHLAKEKDFTRARDALAADRRALPWVKIDKAYFRPIEVNHLRGNYAKAKKKLGWKPKTSFKELVRLMVDADIEQVEKERA